MKKKIYLFFLVVFSLGLTAMAAHKYYVGVFQLEHVADKKIIRMTSRLFIDDVETALNKKYNRKFYFGSSKELAEADTFLSKYLIENIQVEVDGKIRAVKFLGKEAEDDILVCYYTIATENKIKKVAVINTVLFESFPDQQNYIHININRNKKSLLLTNAEKRGTLEF